MLIVQMRIEPALKALFVSLFIGAMLGMTAVLPSKNRHLKNYQNLFYAV